MRDYLIPPHGGRLVQRIASSKGREFWEEKIPELESISLNSREISDVLMIGIGAFSPLEGFLTEKDYIPVVEEMRLHNGVVWSIPITLSVTEEEKKKIMREEVIGLKDTQGEIFALLFLEDIYTYDREREAERVFRTTSPEHPGVNYLYQQGEYLVGGRILLLRELYPEEFRSYWFTPYQTREIFQKKGWRRVVGFQTRNPIHRAHEYIIKTAMEIVDGLFLNPLVGETKKGDIPARVRIKCYEVLLERYFPQGRVFMGVYGAAMRYAGPREAILHALVRKNFGCSHFIVGRDHAGVGGFYGPFDAQRIFDEFPPEDIGIIPLFFDNAFYCRRCQEMKTVKTCPHPPDAHLSFSGSRVRELLRANQVPPPEFTRPEVANVLLKWWREEGGIS